MGINDRHWMQQALDLAAKAQRMGEVPVGAVLVQDNRLLGSGYNQMVSKTNPCAHAELLAIQEGALALGSYRLSDCTLYVTLEPCAMCAGALVHARIKRLVFAARDPKAGAAGSVYNLLSGYPLNHAVQVDEGILQVEASGMLSEFFSARRLV
jgi:tRNA(adenine34) deaminase